MILLLLITVNILFNLAILKTSSVSYSDPSSPPTHDGTSYKIAPSLDDINNIREASRKFNRRNKRRFR
jgi:hypothetical protein